MYSDEVKTSGENGLELLGYTVIASLDSKIEVTHAGLLSLTTPLGFGSYAPPMVEPNTYIKRAMMSWLKELAQEGSPISLDDEEDGKKAKSLVRQIKTPDKRVIILALVKENINLEELGLEYLTNLRVFYVRPKPHAEEQGILTLTLTPSGQTDPRTYYPTQKEQELLDSLQRHVTYYQGVYKSLELRRMINEIIEGMQSTNMRPNGGVSFIPYFKRETLVRLKQLMEGLQAQQGGEKTSLLHIPIVDEENSKKQLAGASHDAFMQRVCAYKEAMNRFVGQNRKRGIRLDNMQAKLAEYQEFKAQLEVYTGLLDVRLDEVRGEVDTLEQQAQELISLYARGLTGGSTEDAPEGETAEEATA
jgi:hypothetical protein